MTTYTKITDYAAKDSLLTGNPQKLVKGVEIGADFDAVVAADATNVKVSGATNTIGLVTASATQKTAPINADKIPISDSAATNATKYLTIGDLKAAYENYVGVAGGTADALTGTLALATSTTPVDGMEVIVEAASANATTTPTFNLTLISTAVGAYTITKLNGQALAAGDISGAGHRLHLVFRDSDNTWNLLNPDPTSIITITNDELQFQTHTAFATAGTATAFTLTTTNAPALTTGERWYVTFNAASGATPTLNRDSKGAKSLKYRDSAGSKQAITATQVPSGWSSDVVYDGTDYVVEKTADMLRMILPTAQATTSGTSIGFTGIPSFTKKITVMFSGVSSNGTSPYTLQIGSGSYTTSGYASTGTNAIGGGVTNATNGFLLSSTQAAANTHSGIATLTKIDGNSWVCAGGLSTTNGAGTTSFGTGNITLGGVLDMVRLIAANGTDTFDAGTISLLVEG